MRLQPWRLGAGVLLAGITLLVACDGENLFETMGQNNQNGSADSVPPVVTLALPAPNATQPLNDSLRVSAVVVDAGGIKSISIRGEAVRAGSFGQTTVVTRFTEQVLAYPMAPATTLPDSVNVTGYLKAVSDTVSEPVDVIIVAKDSAGNTTTVRRTVLVGTT